MPNKRARYSLGTNLTVHPLWVACNKMFFAQIEATPTFALRLRLPNKRHGIRGGRDAAKA